MSRKTFRQNPTQILYTTQLNYLYFNTSLIVLVVDLTNKLCYIYVGFIY